MKITLNQGCYGTELLPDNLTDKSLLKVYFFNILNPLRCKIKLVTIYNNHQNKILCLLLTKVHGNSPKDYQTLKTCIVVITINLMMRSKITGFKYNLRAQMQVRSSRMVINHINRLLCKMKLFLKNPSLIICCKPTPTPFNIQ